MWEPTASTLENSKSVATPLAANDRCDAESDAPKLDGETSPLYHSIVVALLCIWNDRDDTVYAIRFLTRDLCNANEDSVRRLKRMVRNSTTREIWPRCILGAMVRGHDIWWSTLTVTGLVTGLHARVLPVLFCMLMGVCSLSSVVVIRFEHGLRLKSRFYAAVMETKEMLYVQELLVWMGASMRARSRIDSYAKRSVLLRTGVECTWKCEVKVLWTQGQTRSARVAIEKCNGNRNMSDIGTTPLGWKFLSDIGKHLDCWSHHKHQEHDLSWCANGMETRRDGKVGMLDVLTTSSVRVK